MPKKYDTNPLNNNFADEARSQFGQPRPTGQASEMRTQNLYDESQTRRFDGQTPPNNPPFTPPVQPSSPPDNRGQQTYGQSYQTPPNPNFDNNFNNYNNFNQYQYNAQQFGNAKNGVSAKATENIVPPTSRAVGGIGLPENIVMIVPYLPFGFGIFAAIAVLLFSERTETRVRFHAAQALALHLLWVISIMTLELVDDFISLAGLLNNLVQYGFIILLIFACVRVWQGKSFHVQQIDDITDWLESKIMINRKGS